MDQLRSKYHLSAPDDLTFLRHCISSATDILACQSCPMRYLAIIQNAALLGIFCLCLAESYARILASIDEEEQRACNMGVKKQLVVPTGANNFLQDSNAPLTNTSGSFSVQVPPAEWSSIMRQIVRQEVFGTDGDRSKCLATLIDHLEQRQKHWHKAPPASDCPPSYRSACGPDERIPTCLRLVDDARRILHQLKFG